MGALKSERQALIIEAITQNAISTQEELADWLRARGNEVTQATISRDIRELRLIKVATADGGYRYAQPPQGSLGDTRRRLMRSFREDVTDLDATGNLIVVKTLPGSAQSVAAALDDLGMSEIVATLAGDDVILVVVREPEQALGDTTQGLLETFWGWRE